MGPVAGAQLLVAAIAPRMGLSWVDDAEVDLNTRPVVESLADRQIGAAEGFDRLCELPVSDLECVSDTHHCAIGACAGGGPLEPTKSSHDLIRPEARYRRL